LKCAAPPGVRPQQLRHTPHHVPAPTARAPGEPAGPAHAGRFERRNFRRKPAWSGWDVLPGASFARVRRVRLVRGEGHGASD